MGSIHDDVHRRAGVAATWELLRDGHTSHQLTRAVRRGEIIRARQGHYVCPHLHPDEIQAVRVGGRLTGRAAAARYGIWTPPVSELGVLVRPDARALRSRGNARLRLRDVPNARVRVEWSGRNDSGSRSVVSVAECLRVVAMRESATVAFVCVESALHLRFITAAEVADLVSSLPRSRRGRLALAGRRSESGGESLLAYLLRDYRVSFRQQVVIAGAGRVDFLIGDRLVVELDGAEYHTDEASFEEDRRRDAVLSALGYRVLRFSYRQIDQRPHEVRAAISAALARRDDY